MPGRSGFRAWVVPEVASRWLVSTPSSSTVRDLDPPPGGSYRIERTADGQKYVAVGEYCEVMRPSRIVFTFAMPQFAADVDTVTIEIEPEGPRSQLRMNQAGLRPEYEEATRAGWTEMFDLLEQVLAETLRQGGRLRQARRQGRPGDRIESVAG